MRILRADNGRPVVYAGRYVVVPDDFRGPCSEYETPNFRLTLTYAAYRHELAPRVADEPASTCDCDTVWKSKSHEKGCRDEGN